MSKHVERVIGDILDSQTLLPALEGVDWVFQAAAQSDYWRHPELVLQTIVEGTRNVMQAANQAGMKRAVLTSSVGALGVPGARSDLGANNTRVAGL